MKGHQFKDLAEDNQSHPANLNLDDIISDEMTIALLNPESGEILNHCETISVLKHLQFEMALPANLSDTGDDRPANKDAILHLIFDAPHGDPSQKRSRYEQLDVLIRTETQDIDGEWSTIDKIKNGEFFKMTPEGIQIWRKDGYDRSGKEYYAHNTEDICREKFLKKGKKIWIGFTY